MKWLEKKKGISWCCFSKELFSWMVDFWICGDGGGSDSGIGSDCDGNGGGRVGGGGGSGNGSGSGCGWLWLLFIVVDILFYCSRYIILLWCLYYFIVLKAKIDPLL